MPIGENEGLALVYVILFISRSLSNVPYTLFLHLNSAILKNIDGMAKINNNSKKPLLSGIFLHKRLFFPFYWFLL